ncbi:MAG: ABC transporter ATP-binding protein [Acidobacteriaceae bacterium]|nr:ABC transporter ATP-binding protein [Acidobacteriaceae bacterium]
MMPPVLEARRLGFEYTPAYPVINDLSVCIQAGALCAFIGSNGSGKSTLIRLLAGVMKPDSGEVLLHGRSMEKTPRQEVARRLAYVPQTWSMVFPFTALEVVLTGRSPHRPPFRLENEHDHAIAMEALSLVDATHLAERPVTALSTGEQQLVAVARALAQQPECLLLDEPSASLDLRHRVALMRSLVRLRDTLGLAICVVTHDLHLIDSAFDRVLALRGGQLIVDDRPEKVLNDFALAEVYEDRSIRTRTVEGRTLVWCD